MIMKKNNAGFTLIETIVYIVLFAIIMTSGLLAVSQLLQGANQTNGKSTVQDEESFVLRKIDWALSGASNVSVPSQSALSVARYDGNTVDFRLNGTAVEMRESTISATYIPITTINVKVTTLNFTILTPAGITATLTVSGQTASSTRYIRK